MENITTLEVQPYDWIAKDDEELDRTVIHCWAMDRNSVPCLIRVMEFPVFCYLELPTSIQYRIFEWAPYHIDIVERELRMRLADYAPYRIVFTSMKKLYYYQLNRKFPMLLVCFHSLAALRKCKDLVSQPIEIPGLGYIKLTILEYEIDLVRKLLSIRNLGYCQWMRVAATHVDPDVRVSKCLEYRTHFSSLNPIPEEESRGWMTYPRILAFDIESYSDNDKTFTDARNFKHVVYMISAIYQRLGHPESRKRFGIVVGPCATIPDKPEGWTEIVRVKSEKELVDAYAKIVHETDPEIVTGFNIFAYDYPYLDHRLSRKVNSWPMMGRLYDEPTTVKTRHNWSEQRSHYVTCTVTMEGRFSFDLLLFMQRSFKFTQYNLDVVSKFFLGRGKHDITPQEMFAIYRRIREAEKNPGSPEYLTAIEDTARVMAYCIEDSELVIDLLEKVQLWINLTELANIVGIGPSRLYSDGEQVRSVSMIYDAAAHEGIVMDYKDAANYKYEGGFVYPPVPGKYKNVIAEDFASLYPSIIIAYNICYTTFLPKEYYNRVPAESYNSIRPDDYLQLKEKNDEFDDSPVTATPKGPIIALDEARFMNKDVLEGLLPRMLKKLLNKRKEVRLLQKTVPEDSVVWQVLDKRQNSLKVSANSTYGLLGVRANGKRPLLEGAISVTAIGRDSILKVARRVETKYGGKIVYGDTDSCMIDFGIEDPRDCQMWGERISQDISGVEVGDPVPGSDGKEFHQVSQPGLFPPPMVITFERAMHRLICLTKKKYIYVPLTKDGKPATKKNGHLDVQVKGASTARRETNAFLRGYYDRLTELVVQDNAFLDSLKLVVEAVMKLLSEEVNYSDLVSIRAVGSNYKSKTYFMCIFYERLQREGKLVKPGDRLDYLIVKKDDAKYFGDKFILTEEYLYPDSNYELDYRYYLDKVLSKPLNQLISTTYREEINSLGTNGQLLFEGVTLKNGKIKVPKPITAEHIVTLLVTLYQYGYHPMDWYEGIVDTWNSMKSN